MALSMTHPNETTHCAATPTPNDHHPRQWITAPRRPGGGSSSGSTVPPALGRPSAIAQRSAATCETEALLAAFVRLLAHRGGAARGDACVPARKHDLEIREPTIFSRALATQMRVLVVEPLMEAALRKQPQSLLQHPAFAVVDGIETCGTPRSQTEILVVLGVPS